MFSKKIIGMNVTRCSGSAKAPMMARHVYEAVDRTLRDITRIEVPFGGKLIVLGSDFRQVLPVIPRAGPAEVVAGCINRLPFGRASKSKSEAKDACVQAGAARCTCFRVARMGAVFLSALMNVSAQRELNGVPA